MRSGEDEPQRFCLATLEQLMKDYPGGSYLVLNSAPRVSVDRSLMAIGYKYNSGKVLVFIATEEDGSTEPGNPYLSCFPDIFLMFLFAPLYILNYQGIISIPTMQ